VIPPTWTPVHRADGELVGWLSPDGGPDLVVPRTLVGTALGPARDPAAAAGLLLTRGLAALDRRWWARLPEGVLRAAEPAAGWEWQPVVLVEASPVGCTVRLEMAEPAQLRARASLPVPVGDLLRERPPG
jgi:hypothetical protein